MTNYISIGKRKTFKSGTSIVLTIPATYVEKNNIKEGDKLEVLLSGGTDMLIRADKKEDE